MLFLSYRPITYNLGYLQAPFDCVVEAASAWLEPQGSEPPKLFEATFDDALQSLFPLTHWRKLLIECAFGWTAVFKDLDDVPEGPVGTLSRRLKCHGTIGTYRPFKGEHGSTTWGGVQLRYYEDHETEFLNVGRTLSVTESEEGWHFHMGGEPFPFERVEQYKKRRIKERFTVEMLVEYMAHFDIDVVDVSKCGPRCALFDVPPHIRRGHLKAGIPIEKG